MEDRKVRLRPSREEVVEGFYKIEWSDFLEVRKQEKEIVSSFNYGPYLKGVRYYGEGSLLEETAPIKTTVNGEETSRFEVNSLVRFYAGDFFTVFSLTFTENQIKYGVVPMAKGIRGDDQNRYYFYLDYGGDENYVSLLFDPETKTLFLNGIYTHEFKGKSLNILLSWLDHFQCYSAVP